MPGHKILDVSLPILMFPAKVTWPLNPENTVLYSRDVLDFWIRNRK